MSGTLSANTTGGLVTDALAVRYQFALGTFFDRPTSVTVTVNGMATSLQPTYSSVLYTDYAAVTVPLPQPGDYAISAIGTTTSGTTIQGVAASVVAIAPAINGANALDLSSAQVTAAGGAVLSTYITSLSLVDGTVYFGPDTLAASVQRLYLGLLGRYYDPASMGQYVADLNAGVPESTVATSFLASPEYVGTHGTLPDNVFVQGLYQGLLGRQPDAGGAAGYQAQLAAGVSRGQVTVEISDSAEAKQHFVSTTGPVPYTTNAIWAADSNGAAANAIYRTALGRDVDLPTDTNIRTALAAGTPLVSIIANVIASPEYLADHAGQSNTALVASFYQAGLGRAPDPAGSANFVSMLNAGGSAAAVIQAIGTSPEANAHLTHDLTYGGVSLQNVG